jgi:hypothetical protein
MAQREFGGDSSYRLPKGQVEPYRLWFEYLKIAFRHPDVKVDIQLYSDWDDVETTEFENWWGKHWRALFATRAETAIIETVDDFNDALLDSRFVILRVTLSGTKKRRMKDIEDALTGFKMPDGMRPISTTQPAFALSTKRSMNMKTLRGMLKYLQLYEANDWDLEDASLAYFKWADSWNKNVRAKKWKRPLVYIPPFLPRFVEEIAERKAKKKSGPKKINNTETYDTYRNQARRFIRRGEKILKNVAVGKFPGTF